VSFRNRLNLDRIAAHLLEAGGSEELAAANTGRGRGVELRKDTSIHLLCQQDVADPHGEGGGAGGAARLQVRC